MLYKAVLFDFDGVVAETFAHHFRAWQSVLPFAPDAMTIRLNEGRPGREIAKALFRFAGHSLSDEEARFWISEKNRVFTAQKEIGVFPELPGILKLINERGLTSGLVTGTTIENVQAVVPVGLLKQFSVIITDKDTQQGKPHPAPFLAAVHALGVNACDCLVVENAPLGIQSAKAAGTFCLALQTTLGVEQLRGADVILTDHKALTDYLEGLFVQGKIKTQKKLDY